jgi:hypothetical protein
MSSLASEGVRWIVFVGECVFAMKSQMVSGLMRVKPGIFSYALSDEIIFWSWFSAVAA